MFLSLALAILRIDRGGDGVDVALSPTQADPSPRATLLFRPRGRTRATSIPGGSRE